MSNAFVKASKIEQLGELDVLPYMERVWADHTYYPTRHHALIQKVCGDFLVRWLGDAVYIELKVEEENKHGNLFVEMWSNKSRGTQGWFHTCQADRMWYYFLNSRELYMFKMQDLKDWARRNIEKYPEKPQGKYEQLNDTWGRCVPIPVLASVLPSFAGPIDPTRKESNV